MTKTQLLEHSRGSELDHEHRLLSGTPRVCELGVFSCVVGCIRRESVELFCQAAPRVLAWKISVVFSDILDVV